MSTFDDLSRREFVRKRAAHRCEYCQIPEEEFRAATVFHEEHIKPRAQFVNDDPQLNSVSNLAWSCPICNQSKQANTEWADPQTGEMTQLFNPREDNWNEHFKAHKSGHVVGLTATGRATVAALRFNDEGRVRNRVSLVQRRLWPAI